MRNKDIIGMKICYNPQKHYEVVEINTFQKKFTRKLYKVRTTEGTINYTGFAGCIYKLNVNEYPEIKEWTKYSSIEEMTGRYHIIESDNDAVFKNEVVELELLEADKNDGFVDYDPNAKHEKYNTILTCLKANLPVYLSGPAGTGKNYTIQKIAEDLELDFYFTNSVQQEYKITGFIDAGGEFHETEFYKAFKNGGLFFLDELDASIPEVLVLLNAAIANRYFEFPNGRIQAHEDFRIIAAGNTFGDGANEQYTGRMVIDQSTLDRFIFIEFGYDYKVELSIAKGNKYLVDFIEDLRKDSIAKGMRITFSYRCIEMLVALESMLTLEEIMVIAVFKGMDNESLKMLNVSGSNKYTRAFENMKMSA